MTPFSVEKLGFDSAGIAGLARIDTRYSNWPVVYVLDGGAQTSVYVGETVNMVARMRQHLAAPAKSKLKTIRVVVDDTFNKSVCLDLESHLIRWLAADGRFEMLNGNGGIVDAAYYDRDVYRESFRDIFEQLRAEGVFERSIPEIENSDLFKLSPFKALTPDQAIAVEDILEGLFDDLAGDIGSTAVIQGQPGTGKTIIGIFLLKLLADICVYDDLDDIHPDSVFSELFVPENRALLQGFRMGLVVPQQSLRESIRRVFKKTPKLHPSMVLSPWDIGLGDGEYDLLIVDETHRLNRRANQSSGMRNLDYKSINEKLFGVDDFAKNQLDWIKARSRHQLLLVDREQSVRPADLSDSVLREQLEAAQVAHRRYPLTTQMRVRAGSDYVDFVRKLLRGEVEEGARPDFGEYDLRFFDDLGAMRRAIFAQDSARGLARLVAGYAWDWVSKKDADAFDIVLDGVALRWNSKDTDWINSPGSLQEVGSIHTVQGYDLNYAGVIIGADLRYDQATGHLFIDRDSYRDKKGTENNKRLGIKFTDDELLQYIRNVYGVLLTRGMLGTYVYVCDPALREYLRSRLR